MKDNCGGKKNKDMPTVGIMMVSQKTIADIIVHDFTLKSHVHLDEEMIAKILSQHFGKGL